MDNTVFVKAVFDLNCDWEGLPPVYRVYVNDELFTERTWRWDSDFYLEEILQIKAALGKYLVRVESVGPNLAQFRASNHRIAYGPGKWLDNEQLEIITPEQWLLENPPLEEIADESP